MLDSFITSGNVPLTLTPAYTSICNALDRLEIGLVNKQEGKVKTIK